MKIAGRLILLLGIAMLVVGFNNSSSGGCGGPVPQQPAIEPSECTLQVTLNKADAGYTSDLYLVYNGVSDLLIKNTTGSVGAIARRYYDKTSPFKFYIYVKPTGLFQMPYKVYSDSMWARVTQVSDTAQLIEFEDIPKSSSDRDYNDVVIAVEKVNCGEDSEVVITDPGEIPPPSEPEPPQEEPVEPPAGPPAGAILIPAGGVAKVHANFLQATWDAGDLYLDGNPPELLIAKGSNKKGASARNFFYEGEYLVFFLRVAGGNDYYSTDSSVARVDKITDYNYRIYFELDGDADFDDAIVHIVLTPPE